MTKTYKLKNLDCANCAAKIERRIKKVDGVNDATVNFMTSRMTIDAEDADFNKVLDEVARVISRVEADCVIIR